MSTASTLTLTAGAIAAAGLTAVAVADQMSLGWTRADVAAHYGPFGHDPDPNILTSVLALVFACAAVMLAVASFSSMHGWHLLACGLVILVALGGAGFAAVTSFAAEFDGYVFTTFWRFVPWVVPALALIATPAVFAARW